MRAHVGFHAASLQPDWPDQNLIMLRSVTSWSAETVPILFAGRTRFGRGIVGETEVCRDQAHSFSANMNLFGPTHLRQLATDDAATHHAQPLWQRLNGEDLCDGAGMKTKSEDEYERTSRRTLSGTEHEESGPDDTHDDKHVHEYEHGREHERI